MTGGEVDVEKLVEDKSDELDKVLFFQKLMRMRNNDLVRMVSRIMTSHLMRCYGFIQYECGKHGSNTLRTIQNETSLHTITIIKEAAILFYC